MNNSSPFNPNSPLAAITTNLFIFILVIAGIIFIIVASVLVYSIIRYRSSGEDQEPPQTFGNTNLEILWTVLPVLTLAIIFGYMLRVMGVTLPNTTSNPDMIVTGHQWWWEIHYPPSGVVTANEFHLLSGKKYLVRLESADVIHDLWIPELGTKMDLVPGRTNYMYLEGDKTGVFLGTCAEFCGAQHAWMRVRAYVDSSEAYDAWIKDQQQPAKSPSGELTTQGAQLFQTLPCQSCHTIQGTNAKGDVGPDLTHLASRQTLAAGVLENNPDNLVKWLRDPQAVKPGNHMPNLGLTDQQIKQLVAYLETLK
jgi:cytochrome c oxidase subunit 2